MTTEQQGLADGETICLANLHLATAQQVFDQVAKHLLTQAEAAVDEGEGDCQYRAKRVRDGRVVTLKCAAGCLIADKEYLLRMEGSSWSVLRLCETVPATHGVLIEALQTVHDRTGSSAVWRDDLLLLAREYKLSAAVVYQYTNEGKTSDN